MICILGATTSDHWVQTSEPISSPFKEQRANNVMNIDFDVGLWRVCPTIQWTPETSAMPRDKPEIYCSDVGYKRLWHNVDWKELGLWGPVESTTTVISRMRLSTVFILLSVVIIVISTFCVLLVHCVKDKKMLIVSSGLYAFGGLILGSGLFTFVCFLTDEFELKTQNPDGGALSSLTQDRDKRVNYKYGKSFILAIFSFLAAEFAAVLCIRAFLNRFESEEDFVKIIPGMERRIREHSSTYFAATMDTANVTVSGSDPGDQPQPNSQQPSFVHRLPTSVASEESLYGLQRPDPVTVVIASEKNQHLQQPPQLPHRIESRMISDIAVCPPPPPSRTLSSSVLYNSTIHRESEDHRGENDSPSDRRNEIVEEEDEDEEEETLPPTPPPPKRHANSMTLPRLDNYHHHMHHPQQEIPQRTAQIKKGSSRLMGSYSKEEEGGNLKMSDATMAMTTMPRQHHDHPQKKKSVTIGTFTTVETFDFSAAV